MPILTNILQKAGKEPTKGRPLKKDKTNKKNNSPKRAPVKKEQASVKDASLKGENAIGAYGFIMRPHISEKSVSQKDQRKYVFEVHNGVGAFDVARSISNTYGVKVEKVNMIKVPNKKARLRNRFGTKTRYNKAVVTLKKGQSIEILPQ